MNKRQKKKSFDAAFGNAKLELLVRGRNQEEENLVMSFSSVFTGMMEGRRFYKEGHEIYIKVIDFIN